MTDLSSKPTPDQLKQNRKAAVQKLSDYIRQNGGDQLGALHVGASALNDVCHLFGLYKNNNDEAENFEEQIEALYDILKKILNEKLPEDEKLPESSISIMLKVHAKRVRGPLMDLAANRSQVENLGWQSGMNNPRGAMDIANGLKSRVEQVIAAAEQVKPAPPEPQYYWKVSR